MKKLFQILLVLTFTGIAMSCSHFSNRGTIDKPFIGTTNTKCLNFEKIELTDSNTTLHSVIHFIPGWWFRIADSSAVIVDGKKYRMTAINGIPANEQVTMPDSGVMHFTMTFPAIPSDAKSLSFFEDVPSGYYVGDIDLTGTADGNLYLNKIPSEYREVFVDGPMPGPVFGYDTTTVNIHLLGYYPNALKIQRFVTTLHGTVTNDKTEQIDDNGNLEMKLALAGPAYLTLVFGDFHMYDDIILKPGENVNVYVDPHLFGKMNMAIRDGDAEPQFEPMLYHNGYYANLDRVRQLQSGLPLFRMRLFDDPTPLYRMTGDEYTAYVITTYNALTDSINAADIPRMLKEYQEKQLTGSLIEAATDSKGVLLSNYYNRYNAKIPADSLQTILSAENLKRFASLIDFNDEKLLMSSDNGQLTESDISWNDAGIDAGKIKQLTLYYRAYYQASKGELDKMLTDSLRAMNEAFAKDVEAHNDYMKAKLAALDYSLITPAPEVGNDKLLETIVAPYRGKVVMVDLWNTWCGPCRAALAANEPEKDGDLSSDDIVWIYIADESSPMPHYLEMINDIKGVHYRVNEDQIAALRKQFDVDGIPYYILVDKQGNASGRPDLRDHDKFKATILEELAR